MRKDTTINSISFALPLIAGMLLLFAPATANAASYNADIEAVDFENSKDDVTGEKFPVVVIETTSDGRFEGHMMIFVEFTDENKEKCFATHDYSRPGYDDDGYVRKRAYRLMGVEKMKVAAYWVGWYHGEEGDTDLLFDSKNKKVKDLEKWKAKTSGHRRVKIESVYYSGLYD